MGVVTASEFWGGSIAITINSDTAIDYRARVWRVTNTGATTVTLRWPFVALPGWVLGGPVFIVMNVGSITFRLGDADLQDPLTNLAANRGVIVNSRIDANGTRRWAYNSQPLVYSSQP